jgi:hypothetical protein
MYCDICGDQGKHNYQTINEQLRIHVITHQFINYWLKGWAPTMIEARHLIESCHCMFNDEKYEDFCNSFEEKDELDGYKLFKFSEGAFKEVKNWEQLIVVFSFATKLINENTLNIITQWLMHVLVQNDIWM